MPATEVDIEALRATARSVLTNLEQLRHAGLAGEAENAVVAHAIALALGIDGRYVTDDRAAFHADSLLPILATITGPVVRRLVSDLAGVLQAASAADDSTISGARSIDGDRSPVPRAQA
jgi:hypothetical protein